MGYAIARIVMAALILYLAMVSVASEWHPAAWAWPFRMIVAGLWIYYLYLEIEEL